MALPILNDKPKYHLIVPSTGKDVRYRPYLVKEEKILMMALESQDKQQTLDAIVDTIMACVDGEIVRDELTVFDIEYIFLKIRSKSVGEKITIGLKCNVCENPNEVDINVDDVPVPAVKKDDAVIELDKNIHLTMRYPNFKDMGEMDLIEDVTDTEKTFELITKCLYSVQTGDENILIADEPKANVNAFIESLSAAQFEKIKNFVQNMPRLEKEVRFKCAHCESENSGILRGIEDFF